MLSGKPIRLQVDDETFIRMAQEGAKTFKEHLLTVHMDNKAKKAQAGGESKGAQEFDFGNPMEFVAHLTHNERAFLELNPQFLAQKYRAYNLDGKSLGTEKTPSGMVAVCNWDLEEVSWDQVGNKKISIGMEALLAAKTLKGTKLKLLRAHEGTEERFFLGLHAVSGSATKDETARNNEFAVVGEAIGLFMANGVPLYFLGDIQDPTYEKRQVVDPKTNKRKFDLVADEKGHMVHSTIIKYRLDALKAAKLKGAAFQKRVIDKTRGKTNKKGEFGGPCYGISTQGLKNGEQSLSMGMLVTRLDPREAEDKTPNSAYLEEMERPLATEKVDFAHGDTGFVDHDTVDYVDEATEVSASACTSNRPPKGPNDVEEVYIREAFHKVNGRWEVKPEVRDLETLANEEFYDRLIMMAMTVQITNPYTNPYTGQMDGKSNQDYQDDFRKTMGELLGIKDADRLNYNSEETKKLLRTALEKFDQTNAEQLVKMHEALENFFTTQARGNDGIQDTDQLEPFDPLVIPAQGNKWSYNPALTQGIYFANLKYLQSDAFRKAYGYVRPERQVHPTQEKMRKFATSEAFKKTPDKMTADELEVRNHMMKMMARYNRPSRGSSPRSPVDKMLEWNHEDVQALAGYPSINGSTVETPKSLAEKQLFTHASEAAIARYRNSTLGDGPGRRKKCVFRLVTEASQYENPTNRKKPEKAAEGYVSDRSMAYEKAYNAAELHLARTCQALQMSYQASASAAPRRAEGSPRGMGELITSVGKFSPPASPAARRPALVVDTEATVPPSPAARQSQTPR